MIIGEQPGHFRFVWDQTQYYREGSRNYLPQSFGSYSIGTLLNSDLGDGFEEAYSSHYFQLYAVAGPKESYGLYCWDADETMTQLAQRKGWTLLAGPRPAAFNSVAVSSNWSYTLRSLRTVADPLREGWDSIDSITTTASYSPSAAEFSTHAIMLVMVINSMDEIQLDRPVMVLPFAEPRPISIGTQFRLDNVELEDRYLYEYDTEFWRVRYYRGVCQ